MDADAQTNIGGAREPDFLGLLRARRSVMFVSAHPDDEIAAGPLLACAAEYTRVIIVCFTKGEGGGNKIGPEVDGALGEIRARELQASAEVLGAEHRILGFWDGVPGGIRNPDHHRETPEEAILRWRQSGRDPEGELVSVIRQWRPDILITFDPAQGFTGHQEHCAVGRLTTEAFAQAADPDRFPEQLQQGRLPWQAGRLYYTVNLHAPVMNPRLPIFEAGRVSEFIDGRDRSPVRHKTYIDVAMEAWARHESQVGRPGSPSEFTKRLRQYIGQTALVLAAGVSPSTSR